MVYDDHLSRKSYEKDPNWPPKDWLEISEEIPKSIDEELSRFTFDDDVRLVCEYSEEESEYLSKFIQKSHSRIEWGNRRLVDDRKLPSNFEQRYLRMLDRDVCVICLFPIKFFQSVTTCPICSNSFHERCFAEAIKEDGSCPICRG